MLPFTLSIALSVVLGWWVCLSLQLTSWSLISVTTLPGHVASPVCLSISSSSVEGVAESMSERSSVSDCYDGFHVALEAM